MRSLIRKNLIAHRPRNKLTSTIYALTLGTIIFLLVSATLQIKIIQSQSLSSTADITITGSGYWYDWDQLRDEDLLFPSKTDPILEKYKDDI